MDAIEKCRVCGSSDLQEIYQLGDMHISGFWEPGEENSGRVYGTWDNLETSPTHKKWPLTLTYCQECTLLQLAHSAPQEILYARHYWYRSGVNQSMHNALKDIVTAVCREVGAPKEKSATWIDIGANDGTLLSYVPRGWYKVGVEPATNLTGYLQDHADHVVCDFWKFNGMPRAQVITAIGMLYDLEDPYSFVHDMKLCLAEDGIIVVQLMCLEQMLRLGDVGNVVHEHLEYYSYDNLVDLFESCGLEIYRLEENDVNGGSYRLWARHYQHGSVEQDPDDEMYLDDVYWWIKRVEDNRLQTVAFIEREVANGKTVWVYGASTKGCVVLQYYGLDNTKIVAAADRNPDKWGKVIAGTGIPIMPEDMMRAEQPDYLLMLPYAFRDEFVEREKDWHDNGGKWIIPLPELEIL